MEEGIAMPPRDVDIRPWRWDLMVTTMSAEEMELQRFVTDARTHPENYPPHGNAAGATMPPGVPDFKLSGSLIQIARP
jgi:hypothetical protein